MIWLVLVGLSSVVGALCGCWLKGVFGWLLSAAIPWFGLLAWLLFNVYFLPYRGGGASMWPIAQAFAGTVAALVGLAAYAVTSYLRKRRHAR